MRSVRLVAIAALVGAITMAPTELRSADAVSSAKATSASGTTSVTTVTYGAVATGSANVSTGSSSFVLPALSAGSCNQGNNTSGVTATGATTIKMVAVTGFIIGMVVTGSNRIPANTTITSIVSTGSGSPNIVISNATVTNTIPNNTVLTGTGCQRFFSVNNIRALNLKSFGISQTVTAGSAGNMLLQACNGTWTEATGICSGTASTIVTTAAGASSAITTYTPPSTFSASSTIRLRAIATVRSVTSTISISVRAATDLRTALNSNT